jgi:ankyrin repeat protein
MSVAFSLLYLPSSLCVFPFLCIIDQICRYSANPNALKLLLDAGADPKYVLQDGWTALHQVCRYSGNPQSIALLIRVSRMHEVSICVSVRVSVRVYDLSLVYYYL